MEMQTGNHLLLKGGTVIDPAQSLHAVSDVAIRHGYIAAVGTDLPVAGATTIDVTGQYVFPGLIDLHTHICW